MRDDKAVALRYDTSLPAPFIVAKGKKHLAEKIVNFANKYGISVVADKNLVDSLFFVELGDYIPEELFRVTAELLAFVGYSESEKGR